VGKKEIFVTFESVAYRVTIKVNVKVNVKVKVKVKFTLQQVTKAHRGIDRALLVL
jgi:hypothetical protein